MDRIRLHDKTFRPYIPHSRIESSIQAVADRLNRDLAGVEHPVFLCVLKGSFMFFASLMQKLTVRPEIEFIRLSSYSGTASTGSVRQLMGLDRDLTGRTVVIVEDIVDTGNTIVRLHEILTGKQAADIRICTLVLKPEVYDKPLRIDYCALEVENRFIVGFGLDYDQLGRELDSIYILDTENGSSCENGK